MTKKKKYYKPDINKEKPLKLDKESLKYNDDLNKIAKDGEIKVKLNSDVIIQRVAKDLYSGPMSGVRELFNNEARACRQARALGAKPHIEVSINPKERQLEILGVDSLGITTEIFDECVRVLGVSTNFNEHDNEVGMFGMGLASYTTLSDLVTIETWSRERPKDRFAVMGKNGVKFNILPEANCTLDTFGTKVSLTYNDKVESDKIIENLIQYAKFAGIPTELHMVGSDIEVGKHNRNENWTYYANRGTYNLPVYPTIREYIDAVVNIDDTLEDDKTKILWKLYLEFDEPDWEFCGVVYAIKNRYNKGSVQGARTHETILVGTPVTSKVKFDGLTAYVLNIKNERVFLPTADRDRLTEEATEKIQKVVQSKIDKFFGTYNLPNIDGYLKSNCRELYQSRDFGWDRRTKEIMGVLDANVYTTKGQQSRLRDIIKPDTKNIVLMPTLKHARNNILMQRKYPHSVLVTTENRQAIAHLKEHGAIFARDEVKGW